MKYIVTKSGKVFDLKKLCCSKKVICNPLASKDLKFFLDRYGYGEIIKQADTIEELYDEFVSVNKESKNHSLIEIEKDGNRYVTNKITRWIETLENKLKRFDIYGAIWTNKGLIYVTKMKGVLPNGEIDWELL